MYVVNRIVAEVSKTWPSDNAKELISHKFEQVITTNRERGWELESWELSRVSVIVDGFAQINETIIAVFVKP